MLAESRELLALAAILKERSRALIASSRSRIMSSCERLVGRRPRIGGGVDSRLEEGEVRQRVRALLARGVLPGIRPHEMRGEQFARLQDCTICGIRIGTGEGGSRPLSAGIARDAAVAIA
jgi:hypothetical protein